MRHTTRKDQNKMATLSVILSLLLFIAVLLFAVSGTTILAQRANQEGIAATQEAIVRAAVLCYASEGFYPPTLAYIEENYGIQVNHEHYIVWYEIFASNIMPSVRVAAR